MVRPVVSALFVLAVLAAVPLVAGEPCSTLAVEVAPSSVQIDVTGAQPRALTFLAFSKAEGETPVNFRDLIDFTVDLAGPVRALPLGLTDDTGAVSITIPFGPAGSLGVDLYGQAVSLSVELDLGGTPPLVITSCTSNVDPFSL